MMKILMPQLTVPTKSQLKALIQAMSTHGLGEIDYSNFEIYTKKLWSATKLKE